ncbi:MAG: Gfo/Idh/MocA family protein [Planctomycetia bacterium]
MIRAAVVGAGEWGRNHVRSLAALPGARLDWVVETDPARAAEAALLAPRAQVTSELGDVLRDPRVEAIVVATPSPAHHPVASAALAAGKHVLVEKPLAPTSAEAEDLVRRARRARRLLSVGHLLLYHPAMAALKRFGASRRHGPVLYMYGQRSNIGRLRDDEGALIGLAPHDISVMAHLLGQWPVGVCMHARRCVQRRREDIVFLTLRFPGGVLGQVHLSWLEPIKVRRISVVAQRGMAVFDDMLPSGKVAVHGVLEGPGPQRRPAAKPSLPRLKAVEPLKAELAAFLASVRSGRPSLTPGEDGVRVVRVLEAAEASAAQAGREVPITAWRP